MAQPIENGLMYDLPAKDAYTIDVFQGLTVLNQKKYDQTKSRKPLAAILTIRQNSIEFQAAGGVWNPLSNFSDIQCLKSNWMVRNSIVKLGSAWRDQMRNAGVRLKDLPKYGREINLFMDKLHKDDWIAGCTTATKTVLLPRGQSVGTSGVTADDGTVYKFYPAGLEDALFEPFKITVPGTTPTAVPDTYEMYVSSQYDPTSAGVDTDSVIWNYTHSRRSQEEEEDEEELGTEVAAGSATIFRRLETALGDATEEVDATYADYGENRPYMYETKVMSDKGRLSVHNPVITVIAPLGLVRVLTDGHTESASIHITVDGIVEM